MSRADAGLFGPGSMSWKIDREAMILAGGACALLMQLAHPAVAAGVLQHSDFRSDPFARLRRTLAASYAVVFGTDQAASRALARVNAIHGAVRGTVPETSTPYRAQAPDLLLWVHGTLVDTALRVYDRYILPLPDDQAQRYYLESLLVAERLGIPGREAPRTLAELREWMDEMITAGSVRVTPTARSLAPSVLYPTRRLPRFVWDAAHLVSFSVMPPTIRRGYGIGWPPARERAMRRLAGATRRMQPALPGPLREMPQARSAERRLGLRSGW